MSRIGHQPLNLPANVTLTIEDRQVVVKGPKGELHQILTPGANLVVTDREIRVNVAETLPHHSAIQGLVRALIANLIEGVIQGFTQKLELVGTGYRAKIEADKLFLTVGYSHPVVIDQPPGINFTLEGTNIIVIEGPDKQLVGATAARIRQVKPPEPYKGKGVRYVNEIVRRKVGKAAKAATITTGGKA